ncbi:MAG: methyltransferase domain-containing protein [Pseudomonadota bacterium]
MTYPLETSGSLDLVTLYDRLAPDYDKLHRRWLKHAGGEAQAALEASVRALAKPDSNLLDAGCGTGAFARVLINEGVAPGSMTLLDPSSAMLEHCIDMPVRKVNGRLEALPFENNAFDIVTCAWALETVPEPDKALAELCRVVRPGGVLCLAFCATMPSGSIAGWMMRQALTWRGTGKFLSRDKVIRTIKRSGAFDVRAVPGGGPAAALIAKRLL